MIQDIAPHKLFNTYRPSAVPTNDSVICFIEKGMIALKEEADGRLNPPTYAECAHADTCTYLFSIDNTDWFLAENTQKIPETFSLRDIRSLRRDAAGEEGQLLLFASYTALQLANWYRDNRFCGTCGTKTVHGTTERSIICPHCGRNIYPRVIPAVIVGVTDGDRLLHTRYANGRGTKMYALVAGFTEIGETLEETVAREVMEEVGLRVRNIRYFKSQPWGIADDLLAGFYCDVDGSTEVQIDRGELSEAVWISREDITGQPFGHSLTHHMMITFRDGLEPKC